MLTAEEILKIPLTNPGKLFSRDKEARKEAYHSLVKRWHPDKPNGSSEVFAHISVLYKAAEAGLWNRSHTLTLVEKGSNKNFNFTFWIKHQFELGDLYISKNHIGWYIKREHENLMLHGLRSIGSIRFPDNRMKEQHERFLPFVERTIETVSGYFVLIRKSEDVVLLSDLVKHLGRLDPKHMAWVVSSLLNITCFYQVIGLTHNGLTPETVFVSPTHHAAFPLGGWWYSAKKGERLKYLPPTVHAIAPIEAIKGKVADSRIDLASIRAIARFAVGDPTGARLQTTPDIPKPLADWLRLPPPKDAITDYENWIYKVLADSWGPRRFLQLDVDLSAIYG
jgi:hypothetical protein